MKGKGRSILWNVSLIPDENVVDYDDDGDENIDDGNRFHYTNVTFWCDKV